MSIIVTLIHGDVLFLNVEERRWMSSLIKIVVQELRTCGLADHIQLNLEITGGILSTPYVAVIFWQSAVAIKYHNCFLGAAIQTLHVAQVTVGDLLPDLVFLLHQIDNPSAINHQCTARLVIEVKWIS